MKHQKEGCPLISSSPHLKERMKKKFIIGSLFFCLLSTLTACKEKPAALSDKSLATGPKSTPAEAAKIIERFRETNAAASGSMKLSAKIIESAGSTREVRLTITRKRETDGREFMLIDFTAPTEERDRSSLITITPQGDVEATRYAQSTSSFVTAKGASSEDSLFGLSLQELAEGQPEKYDFSLLGEESLKSTPVYRLEGKLKEGADSKFHRLVVLVSKENFAVQLVEFYDRQETLVRRMEVNKVEEINGHRVRMNWTIDNIARRKKIEFQANGVTFDDKLSESLFSRENLKKVSSK